MSSPTGRAIIGFAIATGLAYHGYKKRSLSPSGSVAAFLVGLIHTAISLRFGAILILFYYTSSYLTKLKQDRKQKLEAHYRVGGQRNYIQVFANSLLATIVCFLIWIYCGEDKNVPLRNIQSANDPDSLFLHLSAMFVAHYACSTADTWASELGILSTARPRLAISLFTRSVPHGTNGGMSLLGTVASLCGGAFIGVLYYALSGFDNFQLPMIYFGSICGFMGSFFDSCLGGLFQATYYSNERKCIVEHPDVKDSSIVCVCGWDILSNDAVNVLSILLTMIFGAYIAPFVFV